MSSIPQTPMPPEGVTSRRMLRVMAISTLVTGTIVAVALGPLWTRVTQAALAAHPHAPDLDLFGGLSLAIKIHLLAALAAVGLGAALMLARKGLRFHRVAGWGWVLLVATVATSSLFITSLHPGRYSLLHLFTGWTFIVLPLGVFWAKRRNVARHRRTMMGLFYGGFAINLLIAFIPGRTLWNLFLG